MKKNPKDFKPDGHLRRSQLITTYGPGAMLDLPEHAVLVSGLDSWSTAGRREIIEERLSRYAANFHRCPSPIRLYEPPCDENAPDQKATGIRAILFPLWFLGPVEDQPLVEGKFTWRRRPLLAYASLEKDKWNHRGKKYPVVPVRFVRACPHGHLDDLNWDELLHGKGQDRCGHPHYFDERGASNEISEIRICCPATGLSFFISEAMRPGRLGRCTGSMPWLGYGQRESCSELARFLVRHASQAYFAQTTAVISIPDGDRTLREAVAQLWDDFLNWTESEAELTREFRKPTVQEALADYSDTPGRALVWAEIQRRRHNLQPGAAPAERKSIKQEEFETLSTSPIDDGGALLGEFCARTRPPERRPKNAMLEAVIERVVLVHRLREVSTLLGFTRFEPSLPDIDGELDLGVKVAKISTDLTWLPAIENHGEGVFVVFRKQAIESWLERPAVQKRQGFLEEGFNQWADKQKVTPNLKPNLAYYLLHSISHLLLTAVALDCGYPLSAIRERIYAGSYGYAILLYTAGSGCDGTLGGLVEVGRRIEDHLSRALEMGQLCANDPICAQHEPANKEEERYLQGAACHGCVLIPESCCERRNELLDRALVVDTVDHKDLAFFPSSL